MVLDQLLWPQGQAIQWPTFLWVLSRSQGGCLDTEGPQYRRMARPVGLFVLIKTAHCMTNDISWWP